MLNNIMEKISVWVVNNAIEILALGILVTIAMFELATLAIFYVVLAIVFATSITYLKKRGYVFETENEEV